MGKEYREGHSLFTEYLVCVRSWKQPHIWALLVLFSFILSELYCIKISGWPKSLLGLFHSTLWKNLNEVFDQPSNSSSLPLLKSISFFFFFFKECRVFLSWYQDMEGIGILAYHFPCSPLFVGGCDVEKCCPASSKWHVNNPVISVMYAVMGVIKSFSFEVRSNF